MWTARAPPFGMIHLYHVWSLSQSILTMSTMSREKHTPEDTSWSIGVPTIGYNIWAYDNIW